MHILLTNDDGIYAPGLMALYKEIRKLGKVTVVAPESERSSISHGITLFQPLWYKKVRVANQFTGYALSGTPADCVKFAVGMLLKKQPDFVISGINPGENDGCSVFYSGTVAAAREGALSGIPSFAISLAALNHPDFGYSAKLAVKVLRFIQKNPLPKKTFLNVNVPNRPAARIKGVKWTRQGTKPIHSQFKRKFNPLDREYFWMTGKSPECGKNLDIDSVALARGYVTITPVKSDLTDENIFQRFAGRFSL